MTKDEALKLALEALEMFCEHGAILRPIETRDAIKEALAQPEQEPVGEIVDAIEGAFKCSFTKMLPVGTKLYTTPPQRTWVGLTGEEIEASKPTRSNDAVVWELAVEWAEAKLKEKNT